MLVFQGLWSLSDKLGHFEWKPRVMKLDILPFLDFDMGKTLVLLREANFISQYEVDGKTFGEVINFSKHQRISGKEAQEPAKFPVPSPGTNGEATEKQLRRQEGKGREEERSGSNASQETQSFNSTEVALALGKDQGWSGIWLTHAFKDAIEYLAGIRKSTDYISAGAELIEAFKSHESKQGKFAGGVQKFFQEGKYKQYIGQSGKKASVNPAHIAKRQAAGDYD